MATTIEFDGTELPCPSTQTYEGQQLVDSSRNAQGVVVAQKINRRQVKLSLTWKVLKPEEVSLILNCVEKFSGDTRYFDAKAGRFITRRMYWGDYSVETYWVDTGGRPKLFTNLSTSLIDMGEGA